MQVCSAISFTIPCFLRNSKAETIVQSAFQNYYFVYLSTEMRLLFPIPLYFMLLQAEEFGKLSSAHETGNGDGTSNNWNSK